jgi:hypothetical protein
LRGSFFLYFFSSRKRGGEEIEGLPWLSGYGIASSYG